MLKYSIKYVVDRGTSNPFLIKCQSSRCIALLLPFSDESSIVVKGSKLPTAKLHCFVW